MAKKTLQLYRNGVAYGNREAAVTGLTTTLASCADGELVLARYSVDGTVKTILGVASAGTTGSGTTIIDTDAIPADVQAKLTTIEGKLTVIQGSEAGSINKALADANAYTDGKVAATDAAYKAADKVITDSIGTSTDAKDAATVYGAIAKEADARATADTTLQANITAEAERADAAEKANATAIATEKTRAEGVEAELRSAIDAIAGDGGSLADTLNTAKSYTDTQIQALDKEDAAVAKKFVTSVSEADGVITVSRGEVTSTDKTVVLGDGADGGIDLSVNIDGETIKKDENGVLKVADAALVQYVGANAIAVSEVVDGNKTISLNIKSNDKFLANTADGLSATLNVVKVTEGIADTNVKEQYQVVDKNGALVGEAINIYKDSSLKSVALNGQTLNFTYILADGSDSTVGVDVSAFLHEEEFGNGIQVIDHVASIKVADDNESDFFTVTEAGVKLSGVQEAINTAAAAAKTVVNAKADGHVTVAVETALDGHAVVSVSENDIASANELTNYKTSNDARVKAVEDDLSAYKTSNDTAVEANTNAISAMDSAYKAADTEINAAISAMDSAYKAADTEINAAISAMDSAYKAADTKLGERIDAVSGAAISVTAGNGISVTTTEGSTEKVIAAVVKTDDPVLEVTASGIAVKENAVWDCGQY